MKRKRNKKLKLERCPSGRRSTIGNRVYRKVPRVRIPLSPRSGRGASGAALWPPCPHSLRVAKATLRSLAAEGRGESGGPCTGARPWAPRAPARFAWRSHAALACGGGPWKAEVRAPGRALWPPCPGRAGWRSHAALACGGGRWKAEVRAPGRALWPPVPRSRRVAKPRCARLRRRAAEGGGPCTGARPLAPVPPVAPGWRSHAALACGGGPRKAEVRGRGAPLASVGVRRRRGVL